MSKTLWLVIGAIVAVVVIVAVVKMRGSDLSLQTSSSPSPSLIGESPVDSPLSGVGPSGTASNSAYTKLVTTYAGKRIQFDAGCQAIPKSLVVKNGAKIMFDNRSGDARYITINGTSYRFPGYGYWVIPLSSPTLPKTILLNCGAGVNVGTLIIEK